MQTSTHDVTMGIDVVRKQFLPDHDSQAARKWACLVDAVHFMGLVADL